MVTITVTLLDLISDGLTALDDRLSQKTKFIEQG